MPLKVNSNQDETSGAVSRDDQWEGTWGRINPSAESATVLRIGKNGARSPEEIRCYPYRVLSCWRWKGGAEEQLEIEAGPDVISITGHGLDHLLDALDRGSLELVTEARSLPVADDDAAVPIKVTAIHIEIGKPDPTG